MQGYKKYREKAKQRAEAERFKDDEKDERKKRFSKIWWKSRADIGVSQEYMAIGLSVSRKTIQNWENGVSSPSLFQGTEWFRVLGINPLPYYFSYIFPDCMDGIKPSDEDEKISEALISLLDQLPIEDKRRLLYMLYGNHGSSPKAVLNLFNAHLQLPMKDRVIIADAIATGYDIEKDLDNIVNPDNIKPDMEFLKNSILEAKKVVSKRQNGYSMAPSTQESEKENQ